MKKLITFAIGLLFFSVSICYAHPPECDPGPHGCDNKLLKQPFLQIHQFKLMDKTGKVHLQMDKNGKFEFEGSAAGTIGNDGKVVDLNGKVLAIMRATSVLEDASGTPLVRISQDGTIDNGSGVNIRWTKNGTLKRGSSPLDVKLVPASVATRRTASILFFLANDIRGPQTEELPSVNK